VDRFAHDAQHSSDVFAALTFSVAMLILLAGFIAGAVALSRFLRDVRLHSALMRSGSPGTGEILAIRDTGITVNDNPRIELRLRVTPSGGMPAFETMLRITVSRLALPRVWGDRLAVRFDPHRPDRVVANR
jgi:hypothetical protein